MSNSNSNNATKETQYCSACGKADENLKQCSACKSVRYCGRSCQLAHRKDHKKECKRIEKALKDSGTPTKTAAAEKSPDATIVTPEKMPKANRHGFLSDYKEFGNPPNSKAVGAFWNTFVKNEKSIYHLARLPGGRGCDPIGALIFPTMMKVQDGMGFETGPLHDANGKFMRNSPILEFCIHGDGLKKNFNAVLALEKAAPSHLGHHWKFTFFKPRMPGVPFVSPGSTYMLREEPESFGGFVGFSPTTGTFRSVHGVKETRPIRYFFVPDDDIDKLGIVLFVRGYDDPDHPNSKLHDKEEWQEICYRLLDSILGEWDVEMHCGLIHIEPFGSEVFKHARGGRALELLADEFDHWLAEKLQPQIKELEAQGRIEVERTTGTIASDIGPKNFTGYVKPKRWKDLVV